MPLVCLEAGAGEKFTLFWRPETRRRADSKGHLSTANQWTRALKRGISRCIGRGGAIRENTMGGADSHLEIDHAVVSSATS